MKKTFCIVAAAGAVALSTPAFAESASRSTLETQVRELMAQVKAQAKQIKQLQQQVLHSSEPASKGDQSPEHAGNPASQSGQAVAASPDLHDWSGPYAGANVGAGMTSGMIEDKDATKASDSFSNGIVQGGLHAGYNHQMGNTVLGVEAEVNLGSQDHRGHFNGGSADPIPTTSRIDWSAAILGRAGVAVGNTLLFVDAGPAIAHLKGSATGQLAGSSISYVDSWAPGIKGGAGVEFFVTPNVSVRAQYAILNVLAKSATDLSCVGTTCRNTWTNMQQTATIGADWHF